jgi:uncharacterized protein (DUF433 family)
MSMIRHHGRKIASSLRASRRIRRLVVIDPQTLGGAPVFRGTRVPVYLIAGLVAEGAGASELQQGYPRLTDEMIRLAPVYAAFNAPYEKRRAHPWHRNLPVRVSRRKLP